MLLGVLVHWAVEHVLGVAETVLLSLQNKIIPSNKICKYHPNPRSVLPGRSWRTRSCSQSSRCSRPSRCSRGGRGWAGRSRRAGRRRRSSARWETWGPRSWRWGLQWRIRYKLKNCIKKLCKALGTFCKVEPWKHSFSIAIILNKHQHVECHERMGRSFENVC